MNTIIRSNKIVTEDSIISGYIHIVNGKIVDIFEKNLPNNYDVDFVIDYSNFTIIPGLIEMHIHGFKGWSAYSDSTNEILNLSKSLVEDGITSFLPTIHYGEKIEENIKAIVNSMKVKNRYSEILGIHMEGPFISILKSGSVLDSEIISPNLELMNHYIDLSEGNIKTVTLAPELDGALELISLLKDNDINPCMGHTNATFDEAMLGIKRGIMISQKTGNCMRSMHHREMGALGAAILSDIYNEINSDLGHVSKEFLELIYRVKGYHKLCIIADEGVMTGMKKGLYNLPDRGLYRVGPDNLMYLHGETIDGSAYSMYFGFRNWIKELDISLNEASIMSSLNPAKVLKIDDRKGSIKEGKDADLVVIDDNLDIKYTYVRGEKVFDYKENVNSENKELYKYLI